MAEHNLLGAKGEEKALKYLQQKGFNLLHQNWRKKHWEIDLVMKDGDTMVFVEVKTRSTDTFGKPLEAVTPGKQKLLMEASDSYVEHVNFHGEIRFDVVAVILDKHSCKIIHYPDAF